MRPLEHRSPMLYDETLVLIQEVLLLLESVETQETFQDEIIKSHFEHDIMYLLGLGELGLNVQPHQHYELNDFYHFILDEHIMIQ